jgi:hypothetical protein
MISKSNTWFLARFALAAALLFWLWSVAGWAEAWGRVVLALAAPPAAWLTGFRLELGPPVVFAAGGQRLPMPLNLREVCAGVVPFVALVLATARRPLGSRARVLAVGAAVLLLAQAAVVAMTPLMVTPHAPWVSRLIDVGYTFAVLGGLVAMPLFLWWAWRKIGEA